MGGMAGDQPRVQSDEQVRIAIEKIAVVEDETIRIQFHYPGLKGEKKLG